MKSLSIMTKALVLLALFALFSLSAADVPLYADKNKAPEVTPDRRSDASDLMAYESEQFLMSNILNKTVEELSTRQQIIVLKRGTALVFPRVVDSVSVHYRGTYMNGTEFASSKVDGEEEPSTFVLGDAIPGWISVLRMSAVGAAFRTFIPPFLAYGDLGSDKHKIEPNQLVIYEIEVIDVIVKEQEEL